MRIPQFTGTFVVRENTGRTKQAEHIVQQVVAERGKLSTQRNGHETLFTVPDQFDAQITRAFADQDIRFSLQA